MTECDILNRIRLKKKGADSVKQIFRFTVCLMVMLVAVSAFASCSPNNGDEDSVTTTTQTTTTVATTTTQHGNLAATDVIVRSGPGLDYDAIGGIGYDEEVIILGREGDWYRIQFGDQIGYISAQYVDVDDAPNASEMVEGLKTTSTIKAPVTTTNSATSTSRSKMTTTTRSGATTATGNTAGTTTTGTGAVTTTTTKYGSIPTVKDGIPEVGIIDDF